MARYKNPLVEALRATLTEQMEDYVRKTKIAVAKNRALGMSLEGIKAMRESPVSGWAARREVLNRDMKREVGGIVNRIYHAAKNGELGK